MLKLKRKVEFRGHIYFQAVRPQFILDALNWLKLNNPLYYNITIDINNISANLRGLGQNYSALGTECDKDENSSTDIPNSEKHITNDDTEERDDPLNEYRQPTNETCLYYQIILLQYNKILETVH